MSEYRFVCTALPGPKDECVFVELENENAESVDVGKWRIRGDGLVELALETHPEGFTTVDMATADAKGYASGRESLASLLRDLVDSLEPAIGGIGNKIQSDNAESAVARAKEVIGSFEP